MDIRLEKYILLLRKGCVMNKRSNIGSMLFNAFKISLGCVAAIALSALIGLRYSVTAGLITVLSIQDTKKETAVTALKRLLAFIAAAVISSLCFILLGFNTLSFGVYLFIFIMVCFWFDWKNAIVPVSVLVTHILAEGAVTAEILLNELFILVIGAGIGMLINMHLRRNKMKMDRSRGELDNEIRAILERMSQRILTDDKSDYNGDCFKRLYALMQEARRTAYENRNNTLASGSDYDTDYLKMRSEQCHILNDMYRSVIKMDAAPEQAVIISDFLKKTAEEYHEKNDVIALMEELDGIIAGMKRQKMPESRGEFENRAALYMLMLQIREFIEIKFEFMKSR